MNWLKFINRIKPDGKAFSSIKFTLTLFEVMADAFKMLVDYAILEINDQVWYVNNNFDPVPWEARYGITPPLGSTLEDRRTVVKSYMLYPQSSNRLSKDYIQSEIDNAGFTNITVEYNPTGTDTGFLRANDAADEKEEFSLGSLTYNSFILTGQVEAAYYTTLITLVMGLKPLQVAMYDTINIDQALAYDNSYALALDDTYTLVMPIL